MDNAGNAGAYWSTPDKERRRFILEYASKRLRDGLDSYPGEIPDFLLMDRLVCELARALQEIDEMNDLMTAMEEL